MSDDVSSVAQPLSTTQVPAEPQAPTLAAAFGVSPAPTAVPVTGSTPATPSPAMAAAANLTSLSPTTAVPAQPAPAAVPTPVVVPPPVAQPQPAANVPPAPVEPPQPSAEGPLEPATTSGTPPAEGEDKKTPLEILEEILAGANAEQDMKTKEEAEKKALKEKEKAEMAAKEAAYKEEAAAKLVTTHQVLAEAAQEVAAVDAQFPEKKSTSTDAANTQEIRQLDRDTIQTTE